MVIQNPEVKQQIEEARQQLNLKRQEVVIAKQEAQKQQEQVDPYLNISIPQRKYGSRVSKAQQLQIFETRKRAREYNIGLQESKQKIASAEEQVAASQSYLDIEEGRISDIEAEYERQQMHEIERIDLMNKFNKEHPQPIKELTRADYVNIGGQLAGTSSTTPVYNLPEAYPDFIPTGTTIESPYANIFVYPKISSFSFIKDFISESFREPSSYPPPKTEIFGKEILKVYNPISLGFSSKQLVGYIGEPFLLAGEKISKVTGLSKYNIPSPISRQEAKEVIGTNILFAGFSPLMKTSVEIVKELPSTSQIGLIGVQQEVKEGVILTRAKFGVKTPSTKTIMKGEVESVSKLIKEDEGFKLFITKGQGKYGEKGFVFTPKSYDIGYLPEKTKYFKGEQVTGFKPSEIYKNILYEIKGKPIGVKSLISELGYREATFGKIIMSKNIKNLYKTAPFEQLAPEPFISAGKGFSKEDLTFIAGKTISGKLKQRTRNVFIGIIKNEKLKPNFERDFSFTIKPKKTKTTINNKDLLEMPKNIYNEKELRQMALSNTLKLASAGVKETKTTTTLKSLTSGKENIPSYVGGISQTRNLATTRTAKGNGYITFENEIIKTKQITPQRITPREQLGELLNLKESQRLRLNLREITKTREITRERITPRERLSERLSLKTRQSLRQKLTQREKTREKLITPISFKITTPKPILPLAFKLRSGRRKKLERKNKILSKGTYTPDFSSQALQLTKTLTPKEAGKLKSKRFTGLELRKVIIIK